MTAKLSPFVLLRENDGSGPKFGNLIWPDCYQFDPPDVIRAVDLEKFGSVRKFTRSEIARILDTTKELESDRER